MVGSGINSSGATSIIQNIISGGATVRVLSELPSYTDVASDLGTYEISKGGYSPVTVGESNWTVSAGTSYNDGVSLANDTEISFGEATEDWGEVKGFVVDPDDVGVDSFLVDTDSIGTVPSGVEVTIPADGFAYDIGPSN